MKRKAPKDHIEKPEDKVWKQWFEKLTTKDHDSYMAKLGLTQEDKEELPEIEEQLHSVGSGEIAEAAGEKSLQKKAGKRR
ncbi:MAG: hypothetical protein J4478_00330 [Candidatus Diapherotrites archaeon]|uniref:Uncharacterized protein n=1 Tax=Candidatus Iainarchaeum sp. TaxID=3101447 RepID=A0A7J4KT28_9ARCH|nr:MAG: hypothetical protein QT12_C0033G0004 [archaeon GW2011_AR21]MBS3057830.1 hypothetical protein [Candidatus Diapherotrites archaeon]HIH21227.1 hypothetical protein [Candidatus Diapherotrites archaeon]HIH33143.1 hypothetical protein [Candidatus Diapherotrites archaeon]